MKLGYYSYSSHFAHDVGDMHPEHPMRLVAIEHRLEESGLLQDMHIGEAQYASSNDLMRFHTPGYLDQLIKITPENGLILLDEDTPMTAGSLDAAYQAAGCVNRALSDIMDSTVTRAFCSVRPPGHHATFNKAMGFCIFNNVAVAALKAVEEFGLSRVAVIDFDVHQGNGTIDALANDERFLVCSSFQHPSFPFSHWQNMAPNVINIPLIPESDGLVMRKAVEEYWLQSIQDFAPELVIVSAGFDAHESDPMADLQWNSADYGWLGSFLADLANLSANRRMLCVLEGGYDLNALAESAFHFVSSLKE